MNQALIILRARHVGLTSVRTGVITDAQRQRAAELAAIKRAKEEERARIMNGMSNDRKDYNEHEKDKIYKDSKGKSLKFGANMMTAQEVMPCDQPGGG